MFHQVCEISSNVSQEVFCPVELVGCLLKSRRLRLDRYVIVWAQRKCIQNTNEEDSWISATWKTKEKGVWHTGEYYENRFNP